jgi:hypothetical protein
MIKNMELFAIPSTLSQFGIIYAVLLVGYYGTVRVFRQGFTLEDSIGSHACSLEANMRVTNGIPLGSPPPLTDSHCKLRPNTEGLANLSTQLQPDHQLCHRTDDVTTLKALPICPSTRLPLGTVPVLDRNLYARVPFEIHALLRLKRCHAHEHWHSSRVSTPLTSWYCKFRPNTEGTA